MRELEFLCLAVSRKMQGYCIAGIDIRSGEWVRPVNAFNFGEFCSREITVSGGGARSSRLMRPLDTVSLHLDRFSGNAGQPENWILEQNPNGVPHSSLNKNTNERSLLTQKIRDLAQELTLPSECVSLNRPGFEN